MLMFAMNLKSLKIKLSSCCIGTGLLLSGLFNGGGCTGPEQVAQVRPGSVRIMSPGLANSARMAAFLTAHNDRISPDVARRFAEMYQAECRLEGVNADVAFVQMCLETNFLRFGGQVSGKQNNFCGLGATDDGSAGAVFASVRDGIRAHVQHLKAYGCTSELRGEKIDPRFHLVTRGSAPYIEQLARTWASDPEYGRKLRRLLYRLYQS